MSQPPPPPIFPNQPMPPYMPPQPPKTNGWGIASLICGILGCVPLITSLLAVIFGIVGISAAKNPPKSGNGLSIAGLVLGIIGLLGWCGFAVFVHTAPSWAPGILKTFGRQPAENVASSFIKHLSNGDTQAAGALASDGFQTQLGSLATEIKSYGPFKSLKVGDLNFDQKNGKQATLTVTGTATFDNATKNFTGKLMVVPGSGGGFKVDEFKLE